MAHPDACPPALQTQKTENIVLGQKFLRSLEEKHYSALESLLSPQARFRALLPSRIVEAGTNAQAVGWFERWFGDCDKLQTQQSEVECVFDRLYVTYRFITHHPQNGWRSIEQHLYCTIEDNQIADVWIICSGFRPVAESMGEVIVDNRKKG